MTDVELKTTCRELLARRNDVRGPSYYFRQTWRRHLLFVIAYLSVSGILWMLDFRIVSGVFAGFLIGRIIRDIRWWQALARQWPTNCELLDWPKIERIAAQ